MGLFAFFRKFTILRSSTDNASIALTLINTLPSHLALLYRVRERLVFL